MLILDATIGGTSSNSYTTVSGADLYHEKCTQTEVWDNASTSIKETSLVMASRLLDSRIEWKGVKKTQTQTLFFPAYDLVDKYGWNVSSEIIPQEVKDATAEFARYLIDNDISTETNLDFVRMSNIEFKLAKSQNKSVIPSNVIYIINNYKNNKTSCVKLIRC